MKTEVFLIRHGKYKNPRKVFHGRLPGFSLSGLGMDQARRLAEFLKQTSINALYSNPLTRAWQTAELIAHEKQLKVLKDDRLIDIRTPLEGKPLANIVAIDGDFYSEKLVRQGGESLEDIYLRISGFVKEKVAKHQGKNFVAVTHGDLIMCLRSMCLEGKLAKHYSYNGDYVAQGEGYIFSFIGTAFDSIRPVFPKQI